jgi:hypothetical protein
MAYLNLKQLRFLNRREVSLGIQSIKVTNNESVLTKIADLLLHKVHKCIRLFRYTCGPNNEIFKIYNCRTASAV